MTLSKDFFTTRGLDGAGGNSLSISKVSFSIALNCNRRYPKLKCSQPHLILYHIRHLIHSTSISPPVVSKKKEVEIFHKELKKLTINNLNVEKNSIFEKSIRKIEKLKIYQEEKINFNFFKLHHKKTNYHKGKCINK